MIDMTYVKTDKTQINKLDIYTVCSYKVHYTDL